VRAGAPVFRRPRMRVGAKVKAPGSSFEGMSVSAVARPSRCARLPGQRLGPRRVQFTGDLDPGARQALSRAMPAVEPQGLYEAIVVPGYHLHGTSYSELDMGSPVRGIHDHAVIT
jgi:hypothetical protein